MIELGLEASILPRGQQLDAIGYDAQKVANFWQLIRQNWKAFADENGKVDYPIEESV